MLPCPLLHTPPIHTSYTYLLYIPPIHTSARAPPQVLHKKHGAGRVTAFLKDGRVEVDFDSGESHRYAGASLAKLDIVGGLDDDEEEEASSAGMYAAAIASACTLPSR